MRILYLMMGIPGSGKSTWVKEQIKEKGGIHISRDAIRFSLVKENEPYFSKERLVYRTFIQKSQEAIDDLSNDNIYIDATHLSAESRYKLLNKLNLEKIDNVCVVFINTELQVALARNNKRTGREKVPEDVIISMFENLDYPSEKEKLINSFMVID